MRRVKIVVVEKTPEKKSTCGVCTVLRDAVIVSITQIDAVGTVIIADETISPRLGDRDNTYIHLLTKLIVDRFRLATKKRIILTLALDKGREQELDHLELFAEALKRRAFGVTSDLPPIKVLS